MLDIFYLDNRRKLKKGKVEDLAKLKNKRIWIDVTKITKKEADLLGKLYDFHPVTEEDMFQSHGRIKVEQFPHYLFCTFYGIRKSSKHKIELLPLEFILGKNFIVSTHKYKIESYEKIKQRESLIEYLLKRGVDIVFHRLLDEEIDNFFPVLEELDDQIEKLDEKITERVESKLLSKIVKLKKKIVEIKKITFPQREKISFLIRRKYKFLPEKSQPYFRDIYDHAIWVSDVVENHREAIGDTFDTYMTAVSNNMNEVMKVLSIIATIALPLTVVSGIYGTNFINLPGSESQNGFWIMMLMMGFIGIAMIIFFKERKWF
ncbi:magnesium/cobalt transporter CorA [Candidatus Woesearchaeota archaeon]|nr:magnesium/cobalt transporter CorA [Candidatus Woesearchaeota archaeon]